MLLVALSGSDHFDTDGRGNVLFLFQATRQTFVVPPAAPADRDYSAHPEFTMGNSFVPRVMRFGARLPAQAATADTVRPACLLGTAT